MTYQTERSAIETYFGTQWGSTTTIGYDAQKFTPVADSVLLTIQSGLVKQDSIGRTLDRIAYIGLLQITIITEGGKGSAGWRGYAETIKGFLQNVTISSAGVVITAPSQAFVRFSPQNQHPHIAAAIMEMPFHRAVMNAPFWRYEFE